MPLDPGTTLANRYHIERLHGLGSMGAVYLAFDPVLRTRVAVKENLKNSPEFQLQLQREAAFLAAFRHPNIPRATDFLQEGRAQFLVMTFVDGDTSREWAARLSPSPAELLPALGGIFEALEYLHAQSPAVVHRDVEPSNIILSPDAVPFLVDFGLATLARETKFLVTTGNVLSISGVDPRSDQYALAATIYSLLAGAPPPGPNLRAASTSQVPPLGSIRNDVSSALDLAISRALSMRIND